MGSTKYISIVIPCYNVEPYIDRCMTSLVNQTIGIERLELICIDDASKDHTWDKLLEWEKRYPENILLIRNKVNLRQGGARNIGLQYTSAPYIGFVDSDDWVEETMYEELYEKAKAYHCDIVNCRYKRVPDEETILERKGGDRYLIIDTIEDRKSFLLDGLHGGIVCNIFKRELIYSHDVYFPEGIAYEDNYWGALIAFYVKDVYFVNKELYHYYLNYQSTIMLNSSLHHLDRLKIECMKLIEFENRGVLTKYHDELEYNFIKLYYINSLHIFFARLYVFSIDLFKEMKETMRSFFPNYEKNPYLDRLLNLEKALLETLHIEYTQEGLNALGKRYRDLYRYGKLQE